MGCSNTKAAAKPAGAADAPPTGVVATEEAPVNNGEGKTLLEAKPPQEDKEKEPATQTETAEEAPAPSASTEAAAEQPAAATEEKKEEVTGEEGKQLEQLGAIEEESTAEQRSPKENTKETIMETEQKQDAEAVAIVAPPTALEEGDDKQVTEDAPQIQVTSWVENSGLGKLSAWSCFTVCKGPEGNTAVETN